MGRTAGVITINLNAGTAQFVADMENAKARIRQLGTEAKSTFSARYAIFGLKDVMEGRGKFAVAELVNELTRLKGALLAVGLGVTGLAAVGAAAYEANKYLKEMAEAPQKIASAFRSLNGGLTLTNDALAVSNVRLENEIAKLEGKPQNKVKEALIEAKEAADKLAEALQGDIDKLNKLLGEQTISALKGFFTGQSSSDYLKKFFGGETGAGGFAAQLAAVKPGDNAALLKLYQGALAQINSFIADAQKRAAVSYSVTVPQIGMPGGGSVATHHDDITREMELLRQAQNVLQGEVTRIGLLAQNTQLQGRKGTLEGQKPEQDALKRLQEDLNKALESRLSVMDKLNAEEQDELAKLREQGTLNENARELVTEIYNAKRLAAYAEEMDKISKAIQEQGNRWIQLQGEATRAQEEAYKQFTEEPLKNLEERGKAAGKLAADYRRIAAESQQQDVQHRIRMVTAGGDYGDPLGALAKQQAIERQALQDSYNASLEEAKKIQDDSLRALTIANLNRQHALDLTKLQNEMDEKTAELRDRGVKDFFREMQNAAVSPGNILYDSMHSALDRISDEFARLFTGQKVNFGQMFQQLGADALRQTIKAGAMKGLGKLGEKLGITGAPDGTQTHPFHVVVDNIAPGAGAPDIGTPPVAPISSAAIVGAKGGLPSWMSALLGPLGGLFGGSGGGGGSDGGGFDASQVPTMSVGTRAGGGPVSPDQAYIVGERGPELLMGASGRIVNNAMLQRSFGGSQVTNYIDARGASDPLLVPRLTRVMQEVHQSAISTSVRVNADRQRRVPSHS